jgi:large subunit ribosomal protein L2
MRCKSFNPVHNSMRGLAIVTGEGLAKKPSEFARDLIVGRKRISARNNAGRITVRYRGGGHKQMMRIVDFKRYDMLKDASDKVISKVISLEYDPNRSAFLALLESHLLSDENNVFYRYIVSSVNMKVGSVISCARASSGLDMHEGNAFPLSEIRIGTKIYNIELKHGSGAVIARSAGSYAELIGRDGGYAMIRLRSGEVRLVPANCFATIGIASNLEHKNENFAKAGRKRWMGIRPHVRGVAMNPVDHPHGGGEGKTSGGRHPVTPWGKPTKGKKTRHKNKWSDKLIKSRG